MRWLQGGDATPKSSGSATRSNRIPPIPPSRSASGGCGRRPVSSRPAVIMKRWRDPAEMVLGYCAVAACYRRPGQIREPGSQVGRPQETSLGCVTQQSLHNRQGHQLGVRQLRNPDRGPLRRQLRSWINRSSVVTIMQWQGCPGPGPFQVLQGSGKCYTPDSGHPQPPSGGFTPRTPWNYSARDFAIWARVRLLGAVAQGFGLAAGGDS